LGRRPLALAQELRGLNRIMTDVLDDPAFVRDLMDFTSEVAIVYAPPDRSRSRHDRYERRRRQHDRPRHYRTRPALATACLSIRRDATPSLLRQHMCGNVDALISQMASLPVDIYEIDFPANLTAARAGWAQPGDHGQRVDDHGHAHRDATDVEAACQRCHETCGPYTSSAPGASCRRSPHPKTSTPWSVTPPRHAQGGCCRLGAVTPAPSLRAPGHKAFHEELHPGQQSAFISCWRSPSRLSRCA